MLLEGAKIKVYDPQVSSNKILNDLKYLFESKNINDDQISALLKKVTISGSIEQNAKNSNALVFLTEWDEFKVINFSKLYKTMVKPSFIFDGRKILDIDKLEKIGFDCYEIGKK